ncbi:MAG: hypothetical protein JW889_10830, partial [Verrucomicrobia bacterium]|nr:hypothetical protein [Verrucomicrobiota bacterium]
MKRMCTGRGLVIALIGLAGLTAAMILLITGRSGPEAEAQEAAQEAEPSPVAVESVADQIRRLAIEGEDPQGAVAAALQYLAEHPEVTVERQRVHYELAATQFRAGDEAAALVTFRQIVAQYGNAAFDQAAGDYKVDDALYFISLLEDGAGTPEGRAAAIAAKEALVAQFPTSNFRPRALIELGSMYIENDEDRKPALGMARLRTLAQQHPDSEFAPAAIRTINAWLLDPRAWSDEQPEAECLATVKANVGLLAAKYAGSIDTRQARQDLLWYYDTQSHQEEATALARNIIAIYSTADRE